MNTDQPAEQWMLISISTAGAPPTLRVHVWRKLRSLGALYVQQSVCLLPARTPVAREVRRLVERVRHQGGSARVLRVELPDPEERAGLVAELNAARDEEYRDLLERLPAFTDELKMEQARGRASYVEVEENEADLQRFQTWLGKICARDYFGAPEGTAARAAVTAAAEQLETFEAEAIRTEAPEGTSSNPENTSPANGMASGHLRLTEGA